MTEVGCSVILTLSASVERTASVNELPFMESKGVRTAGPFGGRANGVTDRH